MANNTINILRELVEKAEKSVSASIKVNNLFGFIDLRKGCGTSTVMTEIAEYLSDKGSRVLLIDMNLLAPKLPMYYRLTALEKEKSLASVFENVNNLKNCYIDIPDKKNLYLLSTSYKNNVKEVLSFTEETLHEVLRTAKNTFDYVFVVFPFEPLQDYFYVPLQEIDKGYIVWDEQVDCPFLTNRIIETANNAWGKASVINNVILNKRTKWDYDLELLNDVQCNLVAELPYVEEMNRLKVSAKGFIENGNGSKAYAIGMTKIIMDIIK